jgi:hypothetical protein
MTCGRKSWFCEECTYQVPRDAEAPPPALPDGHDRLPSLLALPLRDYSGEPQPVLRLYRLCDFAEILTRFCTIVALGEARVLHGEALPADLLRQLQPRIELPTFGKWVGMLHALVEHLPGTAPLVVPELPGLVRDHLLPHLSGGEDQLPQRCLVTLRNLLAHGGAMPRAAAAAFLRDWEGRLEEIVGRISFFTDADVCLFDGAAARKLAGACVEARPLELAADLRLALRQCGLAGHVLLLRQGRWLDLWPLCDFGRLRRPGLAGGRQAERDAPMLYLRSEQRRLLYVSLGVDLSHGEREDVVAPFRRLFRLEQRLPAAAGAVLDFEEDLQRDSERLVGRKEEIQGARAAIKATRHGLLWIAGPGGIGKSFLLARLACSYSAAEDEPKQYRIAWRFRSGDGARCNRSAFWRHLIRRLTAWKKLARAQETGPDDETGLRRRLRQLLGAVAELKPDRPRDQPPRVLIFLDGLDEIERVDRDFPRTLFELQGPGVLWVCAGRPEGTLPEVFHPPACQPVFPGGLGEMASDDVRAMLLDGTGSLKYDLLKLDDETPGGRPGNSAVAAVVGRAGGLPLYVRFVIEDVLAGHFAFAELERRLPPGLSAYYDELLRRMSIGDLQGLLTPLVAIVVWAREPLDEETLQWLLEKRSAVESGEQGRRLLRQGLERVQAMIRLTALPDGRAGYEPYHPTFREHVRRDAGGTLTQQNNLTRRALCALAAGWRELPREHPARACALRQGPWHLLDGGEEQYGVLCSLARDRAYLDEQERAFPHDPEAALGPLRAALQAAINREDAPAMAEFALAHARRIEQSRHESPLAALGKGNLERAWGLADLADPNWRVLLHLLIAWALRDEGRDREVERTRERLPQRQGPRLEHWQAEMAGVLLATVAGAEDLETWGVKLSDSGWLALAARAVEGRRWRLARQAGDAIQKKDARTNALVRLAQGQAEAGEWEQARQTAESLRDDPTQRRKVLAEVAKAQARAGEWLLARQTVDAVDDDASRAESLASLARAEARAGRRQEAHQTLVAALAIADSLHNQERRARVLGVVARSQARVGMREEAVRTFLAARQAIDRLEEGWRRDDALVESAKAQAGAREWALALQSVAAIKDDCKRWPALQRLVRTQARAGEVAIACRTAESIEIDWNRLAMLAEVVRLLAEKNRRPAAREALRALGGVADQMVRAEKYLGPAALRELARAQAEVGDLELARQTIDRLESRSDRSAARRALSRAQARAGEWALACRTARAIPKRICRAELLRELAGAQARAGRPEGARRTFRAAHRAAASIRNESYREAVMRKLARELSAAREWALARQTIDSLSLKDEDLRDLGGAQARAGDWRLACETAEAITFDWYRADVLMAVARAQARSGRGQEARQTLLTARPTPEAVSFAGPCAEARVAVAKSQAAAGEWVPARQTADSVAPAAYRAAALTALAKANAERGRRQEAEETFLAARHAINSISGDEAHDRALEELLRARAETGVWPLACQTARAARDSARRAALLAELARRQAAAGRPDEARHAFLAARQVIDSIPREGERAEALSALAGVLAETGNQQQAAEIVRAAREVLLAARQAAESIEDDLNSAVALAEQARVQARSGEWALALQTLDAIRIPWEGFGRGAALLREVATAQARQGGAQEARANFVAARQAVASDEHSRAEELEKLTKAQAEVGEWVLARETADLIGNDERRAAALSALARELVLAGRHDEAVETAGAILLDQPRHHADVARALADRGDARRFTGLLHTTAHDLVAALGTCSLLGSLYPQHAAAIERLVSALAAAHGGGQGTDAAGSTDHPGEES